MSAKKIVKKPAPAKKPVAKKAAPAKKPVAKKPAPAAKKAAPAKKPVAKKPAPKAVKNPTPAVPAPAAVKRAPRPVKPAETPSTYVNNSKDFAYSFAEMMKKSHRAAEQKAAEEPGIRLSRRPTTRAKGQDTMKFPASDLTEFKKRLLALRQTAIGQSATLRTIALEQTDDRGSEDDDGSDVFMRLQNLSQVDSQNKIVQQIEEALHRIEDGTYGICEECGQLIRKPRLLNLPFVRTCMECQNAMENARR